MPLRSPPRSEPCVRVGLRIGSRRRNGACRCSASRGSVGRGACKSLPLPCVAYRLHPQYGYDAELMVLEAVWREPLGAITEESSGNDGYATMAEFRRAWVMREKRRFPLLAPVTVYRVRPWTPEDAVAMGEALLRRLYGEFLPDGIADLVGGRDAW